jgi:hypothetical protein
VITRRAVLVQDVSHPEVHVRADPAVQVHLATAHITPGLARPPVEKRQLDRLLQLERPVADEKDDRDVGLLDSWNAVSPSIAPLVADRTGCEQSRTASPPCRDARQTTADEDGTVACAH